MPRPVAPAGNPEEKSYWIAILELYTAKNKQNQLETTRAAQYLWQNRADTLSMSLLPVSQHRYKSA